MSLHVEGPFVKNFQFFIFGFFPEPKMSEGHAKNAIPEALKSRSPKVTRDNFKFHVISSVGNVFSNTSSY